MPRAPILGNREHLQPRLKVPSVRDLREPKRSRRRKTSGQRWWWWKSNERIEGEKYNEKKKQNQLRRTSWGEEGGGGARSRTLHGLLSQQLPRRQDSSWHPLLPRWAASPSLGPPEAPPLLPRWSSPTSQPAPPDRPPNHQPHLSSSAPKPGPCNNHITSIKCLGRLGTCNSPPAAAWVM